MKVLVAIDGSDIALRALRYVIAHPDMFGAAPEVVLVNVHLAIPLPRARAAAGADAVERYYREEGEEVLVPARALLAGTPCKVIERRVVGEPASQIVGTAQEFHCDIIVMGTHGRSALGNLVLGSVATRVIAEAHVPVLVLK